MNKMITRNFLLGTMALSLAGCGMMNDMHDATMHMNKTTTTMASEMSVLNKKMDALGTMQVSMDGLSKKMDALPLMQTSMDGLSKKMDALPQMQTAMSAMNGKMDALPEMNQNMKDLRGDIKGMHEDITTLTGKMDLLVTMNKSMGDLLGEIQKMSSKMDALPELNQNMKDLRGDIKGMHDDITTLTGKMDLLVTMNKSMGDLLGEIKLMRASMEMLSEMNQNMKDLRGDMKTMTDKMSLLDDMNKNMSALCIEIKLMSGKMDALPEMKAAMDNLVNKMAMLEKMSNTMSQMLIAMRTVFTAQHRGETLASMEHAEDQTTKLGWAAEYMNSQTYQSWYASIDSKETRLKLMALAVPDFFFKLHEYISDHNTINATKQDQQSMNLYAIAATLDYVNSIEMDGLEGSNEPVVSMLSMIEDGLNQKAAVNSGKIKVSDLPEYQKFVLENEQDAIYLLRVRQNFLKGIAYTLLKSSSSGNAPSKIKSIWSILGTRVFNSSVDLSLQDKNMAELEIIAHTLDTAAETENFLIDLGIDPINDKNISALLRGIDKTALKITGTSDEVVHFSKSLDFVVEADKKAN